MIYLYVIFLLVTISTIELLVVQKEYTHEQRLLPLILGLICLYYFYLIVENITGATDVFRLLKYLLLLNASYLMVYYIMDICNIRLPRLINLFTFGALGIANVLVVTFMEHLQLFRFIIIGSSALVLLVPTIIATRELVKRSKIRHIHNVYKIMYVAMLFPLAAVLLILITPAPERVVVPVALMFLVTAFLYLMITGQFFETYKYVMEDLFKNVEEMMFIFDSNFSYIDATDSAKEVFADIVKSMEENKMTFPQRLKMLEWIEKGEDSLKYSYHGKYYKIVVTRVHRNKNLNGYIVTASDISREMEAIESAKEQTRLKSEFLANMSHELRSPLHAIIGGSDIVLANEEISVKNRVMVNNIRNAGNSLLEIVNSILDYSKIEAGKLKLSKVSYNIKDLMTTNATASLMLLKDRPVDFQIIADDTVPRNMIGDKNRIQIVLQNIISNAIKYTESGYVEVRVSAKRISESECMLSFAVEDTGMGMSQEQIDNAFKRYTTFQNKIAESTGIGLYLVKELCEAMGGSVKLESEVGRGSTFTITVKQEIEAGTVFKGFKMNKNIVNEATDDNIKTFNPKWIYPTTKVLVVDDMKVNREIFLGKTTPFELKISEAGSGKKAIDMVKEGSYDLIIMDQMMPEMDGLETSDKIHEFSDVPIVLLTANLSDNMLKQCEIHKLNGYLTKPLSLQQLEDTLIRVLPKEQRKEPKTNTSEQKYQSFTAEDPMYQVVLEAFVEDVDEISKQLKPLFEADEITTFRTKVHGIKGSARQIGHEEIANEAEVFEMAAKSEHTDFIRRFLDSFLMDLEIEVAEAKNELLLLSK